MPRRSSEINILQKIGDTHLAALRPTFIREREIAKCVHSNSSHNAQRTPHHIKTKEKHKNHARSNSFVTVWYKQGESVNKKTYLPKWFLLHWKDAKCWPFFFLSSHTSDFNKDSKKTKLTPHSRKSKRDTRKGVRCLNNDDDVSTQLLIIVVLLGFHSERLSMDAQLSHSISGWRLVVTQPMLHSAEWRLLTFYSMSTVEQAWLDSSAYGRD